MRQPWPLSIACPAAVRRRRADSSTRRMHRERGERKARGAGLEMSCTEKNSSCASQLSHTAAQRPLARARARIRASERASEHLILR